MLTSLPVSALNT